MSTHETYETVQVLWKVYFEFWREDDDDPQDAYSAEEQAPLLADMFNAYSHSYQATSSPHSEHIAAGVREENHFLTFDKELGVCLCVNYGVSEKILYDTEKFKKAIQSIDNDIGLDCWLNTHFHFKSNGIEYCGWGNHGPVRIVAPVEGSGLLFKWSSIDEIANVEWALSHDNGAHGVLFDPKEHEAYLKFLNGDIEDMTKFLNENGKGDEVDSNLRIQYDREILQMIEFVKQHKDNFFYGNDS